jgi:hypothetical protein
LRPGVTVKAVFVWLAIIVMESMQGVVRRIVAGDDLRARQVGTAIGAAIVLAIAFLTIRQIDPRGAREALAIGALWVVLTVSFDLGLGWLTGASVARLVSDFDLVHGGLLPVGLAVMLVAPLIAKSVLQR